LRPSSTRKLLIRSSKRGKEVSALRKIEWGSPIETITVESAIEAINLLVLIALLFPTDLLGRPIVTDRG